MGKRVALTALMTDPGVEAAAESVAPPIATPPPPPALQAPPELVEQVERDDQSALGAQSGQPAPDKPPAAAPRAPRSKPPASVVRTTTANPVSSARVRTSDRAATPSRRRAERATVDLTARTMTAPPAAADDGGDDDLLFSELERKEARLRLDQVEDLSRLAKRLNRARRGQPGRRITENTLIRVALDYLLEHQGELAGRSESELLDDLRAAR